MRKVLFLGVLLVLIAGVLFLGRRPVAPFQLYGQLSPSRLEFQGQAGTAWKNITWKMDPQEEGVAAQGQLGSGLGWTESDLKEKGGWLLDVSVTGGRVHFENLGGARWDRLSVGCGDRVPCEFLVDESGVRLLDDPLGEAPLENSPRGAILRLVHAILTGDKVAFTACFAAADPYDRAIAAQGRYYLAAQEFKEAWVAAYGYDSWLAAQNKSGRIKTLTPGYYNLMKIVEMPAARGDTLRVSLLGGDWPAVLVRPAGRWLFSARDYLGENIEPEANIRVMDGIVAEMKRFQPALGHPDLTPADIDHEFDRALMAAMLEAPRPTPRLFDPEALP